MRFKLTIILMLLNVAAFYYIFHLEKQSTLEAKIETEQEKILGPEVVDIEQLKIALQTEEEKRLYSLIKHRNGWSITEPISWPANANAIDQILAQLQALEKEISFSLEDIQRKGQTLEDYGLNNPILELTFSSSTGVEKTLRFGNRTQMGSRIYILHPNGNEILVVQNDLLKSLSISLNDLLRKEVIDIPVFEARSLMVEYNDQRVRIEKDEETWKVLTPIEAAANTELVISALTELTATQANLLVASDKVDLNEYGLINPSMRVTIEGNNRRKTIFIGNAMDLGDDENLPVAYHATLEDSPTVFVVKGEAFDRLKKGSRIFTRT